MIRFCTKIDSVEFKFLTETMGNYAKILAETYEYGYVEAKPRSLHTMKTGKIMDILGYRPPKPVLYCQRNM